MKNYLTTKELAARWKMHVGSLANQRLEGRGPEFFLVGRTVCYPLVAIIAWEKSRLSRVNPQARDSLKSKIQ